MTISGPGCREPARFCKKPECAGLFCLVLAVIICYTRLELSLFLGRTIPSGFSGPQDFLVLEGCDVVNKKLSRLLEPSMAPYFLILLVFAAAALYLGQYTLALLETATAVLVFVIYRLAATRRSQQALAFLKDASPTLDTVTRSQDTPIPMASLRVSDQQILWANDAFYAVTGLSDQLFEARLTQVAPDFSLDWLKEPGDNPAELTMNDKRYRVFGNLVQSARDGSPVPMAMLYFIELSDLFDLRDTYLKTRPVVSIILVDNYEELMNGLPDSRVSGLSAQIGQAISDWVDQETGSLHELSRNRYIYFCEAQNLEHMTASRFSILESIREIKNPSGLAATVSIGIGRDGAGFQQTFSYATKALEMCMYRGGDQVVVKGSGDENYTYYGGRAKEGDHRTAVRARVIASGLKTLVEQADSVFIMGHVYADFDAMGSAAGLYCLCRNMVRANTPIYIIYNELNAAQNLIDLLQTLEEYQGVFISAQEALQRAERRSLLIVTDTNRPSRVESRDLLDSMLLVNRVVVIDHHRRAADFIDPSLLAFHEPSASSAAELVTELLQHTVSRQDILPAEAVALLTGIVLDTKQFSTRTGTRTFESAAFLRQAGGDPTEVKKLFQNNLPDTLAKHQIVSAAFLYRKQIAISMLEQSVDQTVAAQAADELLNVQDVTSSFVLYPTTAGQVKISARSLSGGNNVQMIMESMGGGGNQEVAAALLHDTTNAEALKLLCEAIDRYLDQPEAAASPQDT